MSDTASNALPPKNLAEAKYECIFGRGCDGICCRNGRPPLFPDDLARIEPNLEKFLPAMRPEAVAVLRREGYRTEPRDNTPGKLRVVGEWCIFFNQGCVLHKVGAAEGDAYRYKPARCALFPLARDKDDRWYVRQHGLPGEKWDLFCLDPKASNVPASESLREELKLAATLDPKATR